MRFHDFWDSIREGPFFSIILKASVCAEKGKKNVLKQVIAFNSSRHSFQVTGIHFFSFVCHGLDYYGRQFIRM